MDRDKKDSNIIGLRTELKRFESKMEKLERSLVPYDNSLVLEEKTAVRKELSDRLEILRRQERRKELRRQLERDIRKIAER